MPKESRKPITRRDAKALTSSRVWAKAIFGGACLNDPRRTQRLVRVASVVAARPLDSFNRSCATWGEAKGAYRLIENEHMTAEQFQEPSTRAAVLACRGQRRILVPSDTTPLNFTAHPGVQGLGPIGEKEIQGLLFHSSLALLPNGLPLGLLRQQVWTRDPETHGSAAHRKQRPIEEKESFRWLETMRDCAKATEALPEVERPYLIHVFDREGDIHEVFEAAQEVGAGFVIRSAQDRRVEGDCAYLRAQALQAPILGRDTVKVPREKNRPERKAEVLYRACTVTLKPKPKARQPVELNVVAVIEEDPPAGVEPLEWILVTTEPIDSLADVLEVAQFYRLRWRVEEYHTILKSGCRIEEVQFETAERIKKVLAIMAAVAVRLLQITYLARVEPDTLCTVVLSENEWRALQTKIQGRPPTADARAPTLKQAVLWVGRLGGHLGRTGDGMPGIRTIWKGWRDLALLTAMYDAFTLGTDLAEA